MLKGKKIKLLPVLALMTMTLASCSTDYKRYPLDYEDALFGNENFDSVYGNNREDYYDGVLTSDEVYSHAVDQILLDISKVAHGYTEGKAGTDVTKIIDDSSKTTNYSVADGKDTETTNFDNLHERASKNVLSGANTDSYKIDNLFYEKKYVQYLKEQFQLPSDFDESKIPETGILVTPDMTYDEVFAGNYDSYMEKYQYDDLTINYLTSEYIYTKSFSSIGNTNARKVQIISLTDREDDPGAARQLLDAYVADYIMGENGGKYLGKDPDFAVLSRLWKGITAKDIESLVDKEAYRTSTDDAQTVTYDEEAYASACAAMRERYKSVILSDEETAWLKEKGILPEDDGLEDQGTLAGKIAKDQYQLEKAYDDNGSFNMDKLDTSLESQYTGSYTYDYRTGLRMAYDDIAEQDLVTDGIHLSSDGLSNIPTDLKNRIFSTDITTEKSEVDEMKKAGEKNENAGKDITTYMADGNRYLTIPGTAATDEGSSILYYDTGSRTYYITRILDVVDNDALGSYESPNTDSIYDTAEKQERIAREVAYAMSTTGSYKSNATIYWLRRTKIDYSDDQFLEYMKTNYQDLFRTESATDGDPLIELPND